MSTALHRDFVIATEAVRVLTPSIRISSIIAIIGGIRSAAAM